MLIHYPAGPCYVAASLEKAGFPVVIYNADYEPGRKTILGNTNHLDFKSLTENHAVYEKRLHDPRDPIWAEIRARICGYQPDVLILSAFNTTLTACNTIARIAKEWNPKVVTVFEGLINRGLHCATDPSQNSDWAVMDFALRREPEATAVELLKALEQGSQDFSGILGLSFKTSQGEIVHNPDRPFLADLDSLPFPARHCLEDAQDIPPHCFQGIYGSRGCPFDCVFCGCHVSMGYRPRVRSAANMIEEMESVFRRYGTRYFYICDDIFFIQKERAREFCRLLIGKGLPIYWSAQTRAEMVDDETLALMKKAGGQHVAVGVEVGNPRVRELIRKGNTVEDVVACSEMIRKHGLFMVAFCMVGLPWEGKQEIRETVRLIKRIKPYIVYSYLPTPSAGTELAQILMARNPDGWRAFRDKSPMSTSEVISERIPPEEKQEIVEWALGEFEKINKRAFRRTLIRRIPFYVAMAQDMHLFKHPEFLATYVKDLFFS
jgi:radical SAM superfamily enzyme YgiQ (UPF0313 family)